MVNKLLAQWDRTGRIFLMRLTKSIQSWQVTNTNSGFTLIEMMIGLGLAGVIFYVSIFLMDTTGNIVSVFSNNAATIEAVGDAIAELNTIMPQIVQINSCGCRGANSTALANCVWNESTPWYDPVKDGGAATGVVIFDGEFESFYGGTNALNTTQLLTSNITYSANGGCDTSAYVKYTPITLPAVQRGCKQHLQLVYTAPVIESGSTQSVAGMLQIDIFANSPLPGVSGYLGSTIKIADANINGAKGVGLTELSCGFYQSTQANTSMGTGTSGLNFVLNLKLKTRTTTDQTVADGAYESWYPTSAKYGKGAFRDIRSRYNFLNLNNRGVYQWKTISRRNCVQDGSAATNVEDCCSTALNAAGTVCAACLASTVASTNAYSCCSARLNNAGTACL